MAMMPFSCRIMLSGSVSDLKRRDSLLGTVGMKGLSQIKNQSVNGSQVNQSNNSVFGRKIIDLVD